jgi:hypothetical protein
MHLLAMNLSGMYIIEQFGSAFGTKVVSEDGQKVVLDDCSSQSTNRTRCSDGG